jgi:hypothetical protein
MVPMAEALIISETAMPGFSCKALGLGFFLAKLFFRIVKIIKTILNRPSFS